MCGVWNGYNGDSEIVKVLDTQTALKHLFSPIGKSFFYLPQPENELQYRGLAMRDNSAYDACISCENFVKIGPVTPELTGLICERLV